MPKVIEIQDEPQFKESITISQNAFSSGLIITYISELKLELDSESKWKTAAQNAVEYVQNLNSVLIERTKAKGVKTDANK
jgi:hypothetical protein